MQYSASSIFLADHEFGNDEPNETAKLTLFLIASLLEFAHDYGSQVAESVVVQKTLVLIELDDIAGQVKQNSPSASVHGEALRIFKVSLLGLFVFDLVFAEMTTQEKLLEVTSSEGQYGGNQSIFSEDFYLFLSNGKVARVNLVLCVNSY